MDCRAGCPGEAEEAQGEEDGADHAAEETVFGREILALESWIGLLSVTEAFETGLVDE